MKVINGKYEGVTTVELDTLAKRQRNHLAVRWISFSQFLFCYNLRFWFHNTYDTGTT